MRLIKHHSITHAERVLREARRAAKALPGREDVDILHWSNGREQGYRLVRYGNARIVIWFAEARQSEATVIAWSVDHAHRPEDPSEQDWDERRVLVEGLDARGAAKAGQVIANLLASGGLTGATLSGVEVVRVRRLRRVVR